MDLPKLSMRRLREAPVLLDEPFPQPCPRDFLNGRVRVGRGLEQEQQAVPLPKSRSNRQRVEPTVRVRRVTKAFREARQSNTRCLRPQNTASRVAHTR